MKYCIDCEWSVRDEEEPAETDLSKRAIDHVTETGHSITSDDPPFPSSLVTWTDPELSHLLPVTLRRDLFDEANRRNSS